MKEDWSKEDHGQADHFCIPGLDRFIHALIPFDDDTCATPLKYPAHLPPEKSHDHPITITSTILPFPLRAFFIRERNKEEASVVWLDDATVRVYPPPCMPDGTVTLSLQSENYERIWMITCRDAASEKLLPYGVVPTNASPVFKSGKVPECLAASGANIIDISDVALDHVVNGTTVWLVFVLLTRL